MDKPGEKETITVKINGKDRPSIERKNNYEKTIPIESEEKKSDSGSAVEKDTTHYTVGNAEMETAAAEQLDEESFDWILPEKEKNEELNEYKVIPPSKGSKRKGEKSHTSKGKKSITKSILFIVISAIIIGSSLGMIMIRMVKTDVANESGTIPVLETGKGEKANQGSGGGAMETVPFIGYMVQAGAFTTAGLAKKEVKAFASKGNPAISVSIDKVTYVFIGVANTLDHAKALEGKLEGEDNMFFAKEVQFGGTTGENLLDSEKSILEKAPSLFEILSEASANAAISNTIPAELLEKLNKQANEWNKAKKEGLKNKIIIQIKKELDGAINHIRTYHEKGDKQQLVESQQNLLNFVALYQSI